MKQGQIRRKDRMLNEEESRNLLLKGEYGVLATVDEAGQPYATPLSYVYLEGKAYFHCAREGHKIDNLNNNPRICFTVVGPVEAVYDRDFSTYYESVIFFGKAQEIDGEEKKRALLALAEKYLPDHMDKADGSIEHLWSRTAVYGLVPEMMTGKAKKK